MVEAVLETSPEAAQPRRPITEFLVLHTGEKLRLSDDDFLELSSLNRDLRLEQTAEGDLIIMPPTGYETGDRNSEIIYQLRGWAKKDGRGVATDSQTGFVLPNNAKRAPDAAWTMRSRLAGISSKQKQKLLRLCPDFVVELKSPTDKLEDIEAKMREYIENGAQLGWLLNPEMRRVSIYRPNMEVEILDNAESISGEPLLTGFTLDLREIWQPNI